MPFTPWIHCIALTTSTTASATWVRAWVTHRLGSLTKASTSRMPQVNASNRISGVASAKLKFESSIVVYAFSSLPGGPSLRARYMDPDGRRSQLGYGDVLEQGLHRHMHHV